MNYKEEMLLMLLIGFAMESEDIGDKFATKLSNSVKQHFRKQRRRYSKEQAELVVSRLKDFSEKLMQPHRPTILLILSVNYLLNAKHKEARIYLGHYSSEVKKLILRIRVSDNKESFLEHKKFFDEYMES